MQLVQQVFPVWQPDGWTAADYSNTGSANAIMALQPVMLKMG